MIIRKYKPSDCNITADLFYNTVHFINKKDYSVEQLNVWADKNINLENWNNSLLKNYSLVAVIDEIIVGFGDIDNTGYLDRLFVHKDYQKQGIASMLCDNLEQNINTPKIITHASITARPFFEKRGYIIVKKQNIKRNGIIITNYIMEKYR